MNHWNESRGCRTVLAFGRVRGLAAWLVAALVLVPACVAVAGSGRAEKRYAELVKQLRSTNKRERALAANKLADWEGRKEQSADKIGGALLRERDKYTGKQMVKALARIGTPKAYRGLQEAMKARSHEDVRMEIVKWTGARAAAGAPKEVAGIWDWAVKDPSYKVQNATLDVLVKRKWATASIHVRKAAGASRFAVIRARAVYMIGLSKELSVKAFVRIYWKDPSPRVRMAVLDVVAMKPGKEALDLLKLALDEKSADVRMHALKKIRLLFARVGDGSVVPGTAAMREALLRAAKRETSPEVLRLLIQVLGGFPMTAASEKIFIESQKSGFPLVRIAGCRALSKAKSREAARALGSRRVDKMPSVRRAAATALVKMGTSEAVEALIRFVLDADKDVYKVALEGLATIGDRRTVSAITLALRNRLKDKLRVLRTLQALRLIGGRLAAKVAAEPKLLGHKEKMVRFEAARALAEHPWADAVPALIERVSKETDPRTLVQVIEALAPFKTPRVMSAVSAGLKADQASVVKAAIIALRGARNRSLVDDLDQVFNRKDTRQELVRTLASIGGPKAAARLHKLFSSTKKNVRYVAIEGLGSCGLTGEERDKYVEILIGLFEEGRGKARETLSAATALGNMGGERALRFLKNQTLDNETGVNVRTVGMATLVRANHPDAYKAAVRLAGSTNGFLRRAGYEALGDLGEEKGIKKLLKALGTTSGAERTIVVEALAKNGEADGVLDKLKKALKKEEKAKRPDVPLRVALVTALARIDRSSEMAEKLTKLLEDEEFRIQLAACRALATFKHKPSIEKLLAMMNGENKVLRQEAVAALEKIVNVTFGRFSRGWAGWWKNNKDLEMDRILIHGFARHSSTYKIKGNLTDGDNVAALLKALSDYEESCRYNAARVLREIAEKNIPFDFKLAHDAGGLAAWKKWNAENNG